MMDMKDVQEQVSGIEKKIKALEGDLEEGQELDLAHLEEQQQEETGAASADIAPGIDYGREYVRGILHSREQAASAENAEMKQTINAIVAELERIAQTAQIMEKEVAQVTMMESPEEVGTYHVNFFEWMLLVLQQARAKIEDSGAWMTALTSKKSKRGYWQMFKKHGTSFGMSNERMVATQTG
jgi:hypothetical protein